MQRKLIGIGVFLFIGAGFVAAGDLKRVRVGRYRGTVRIVLDLARETLRLPRIIERDTGLEIAVADDP